MPSLAGIEYTLIDDAPTIKWDGKYYREGIGEISEQEAMLPYQEAKDGRLDEDEEKK